MPRTTTKTATTDDRDLLLRIADEAFDRPSWNDVNLRSALRGVRAGEASWLPPGGRRTIAANVMHCAYWKYIVRRRLLGDRRRTFPRPGRDWFDLPAPLTESEWIECLDLLVDQHRQFREAVRHSTRALRYGSPPDRNLTRQVFGIAMHDTYHTGQIRLIRALYRSATEA